MRIFEDRYFRDLRPLRLAARMLNLEARTRTICVWTGLTRDRIRKLAGSALPSDGSEVSVRHRGRSPLQTAYFFRSAHTQTHASVIASHFALVGLLPDDIWLLLIDLLAKATKAARLCEACKLPDTDVDISRYLDRVRISEPEQMQLFGDPELTEPSRLNGSPAKARSTEAEGKNHGSAPAASIETTLIPDTPEPSEDSQ